MSMGELSIERARELDAADPLAGFRERFAWADPSLIYLNGNSLGALPKATRQRLATMITQEWGTALARSRRAILSLFQEAECQGRAVACRYDRHTMGTADGRERARAADRGA